MERNDTLGQLEKLESRYNELEQILASGDVISDKLRYSKLAKELASLRGPVLLFRDHKKVSREMRDLESALGEKHEREFLDLAKEELQELKNKKYNLENKIQSLLAGEDKDSGKSIIVEIRQGTGGDEAGLFAADLYRMYSQYAANKGWEVEPMSGS
ncbi:MAG: PCRF domain-containing protein, partial [Candidatus Omnitrophota bacterium]